MKTSLKTRRKRFAGIIIPALAALLLATALPAFADTPVAVTVNGRTVAPGQTFARGGVTYAPVRDFALACGSTDISWDATSKTARVATPALTLQVPLNRTYETVNGRCLWRDAPAIARNGSIYAPVSLLAAAFGGYVTWVPESSTASVTDIGLNIKNASQVYNSDDLYWLARIIHAEASGEPFKGKIAVGNVILNRAASPAYPSGIREVIFDTRYGVQFSPVSSGTVYNEPSEESVLAAKACLEGYSLSYSALYFLNPAIAQSFWIVNNCRYEFTVGSHDFYS